VGSDLLDDEKIELGFVDTLRLSSKTIEGEKVITYRRNVDSRTYLVGELTDGVFGKSSAEIYFSTYLNTPNPDFADATLDSMVMALTYDTLGSYGKDFNKFKIELFQLESKIPVKDTFYSNESLSVGNLIGTTTQNIRPKDSITVVDHITKKAVKQSGHLRIKLDQAWANALFSDKNAALEDTSYVNYIKGFALRAKPVDNPGMFGINFSNQAINTSAPHNKLFVYYHKKVADTIQRLVYAYPISTRSINNYVLDKSGSKAQELLNNSSLGNMYSLLQGLGGVKTSITFDDLSFLKNKKITKVELDVFAGLPIGQNPDVKLPVQLIASRYRVADTLELIPDIKTLQDQGILFTTVFGGALENKTIAKYTLNITNHIRKVLDDSSYRQDLVIGILTESEVAAQVVLYGAKHPTYPMRLRVSYAK
jgi:hypothetical protein